MRLDRSKLVIHGTRPCGVLYPTNEIKCPKLLSFLHSLSFLMIHFQRTSMCNICAIFGCILLFFQCVLPFYDDGVETQGLLCQHDFHSFTSIESFKLSGYERAIEHPPSLLAFENDENLNICGYWWDVCKCFSLFSPNKLPSSSSHLV